MQIEKLLTLSEAQGIDYEKLSKAGFEVSGRRGGITGQDVQLVMSWLPPQQRAILYLKPNPARVTGQDLAALTNHLWRSLIMFEATRRPPYDGEETNAIKALLRAAGKARDARQARTIRTALSEYEDTRLCLTCAGSRESGCIAAHIPGQGIVYTTCPKCNGRTWIPWSDNHRAGLVGGKRQHWRERHERGYQHVLNECSSLHAQGVTTFKQALFGPALVETKLQARA